MTEEAATNPVEDDALLSSEAGVEADGQEADDQDLTDEEAGDGQAEDDSEEIEHEGQKYRLPKALKPALMMQQDYTRKTQELAELRRATEAEAKARQTADEDHIQGRAKVFALSQQLAEYDTLDWETLYAQDQVNGTNEATRLLIQQNRLKAQLEGASRELTAKEEARVLESQREAAKRAQEGLQVLQREIPDWSPKLASELVDFGSKTFGFTQQELGAIDDPRMVKVLHAAMQATKVKTTAAKAAQVETAKAARPVPAVGARAPATSGLSDNLSADEWLRRRNAQLAKRRG